MTDKASTPIDFGDWLGRIVFRRGAVAQLGAVLGRVGGSHALVILVSYALVYSVGTLIPSIWK